MLLYISGNYREALKFQVGQQISFDRDAFIQSRPANIQPFLEQMLSLQVLWILVDNGIRTSGPTLWPLVWFACALKSVKNALCECHVAFVY